MERTELELSPPDKVQVAVLCFLLLHVKAQALAVTLIMHTHYASLPVPSAVRALCLGIASVGS